MAGISVGTLYQYFPDKHAILEALRRRELTLILAKLQPLLAANEEGIDKIRLVVRTLLFAFGGRHRVRKILVESAHATRGAGVMNDYLEEIGEFLNAGRMRDRHGNVNTLPPMTMFVLLTAITGVIRGALARDADLLSDPELEENLVQLIRGFMQRAGNRGRE